MSSKIIQGLAAAALAVLLFFSAPFQIWLGHGGVRATRAFPHHLLPLRLLEEDLAQVETGRLSTDLPSGLEQYRSWFRSLGKLRSAGVSLEPLESARGRIELRLAFDYIRFGQPQFAHWHLLEAARYLQQSEELRQLALLAGQQGSWQALARALAHPGWTGEQSSFYPTEPAARAELQRWLGSEFWARGQTAAAQQFWKKCSEAGSPSCYSALATSIAHRNPTLARQYHLRALELDPHHGPSLLALVDKEKMR